MNHDFLWSWLAVQSSNVKWPSTHIPHQNSTFTYDIWCHMAFHVTTVTFLVALSMNNFTTTVIPTFFQFVQPPITETNVWYNLHPNMMKHRHGGLKFGRENTKQATYLATL